MANLEKHKRNLVEDWLGGEEGAASAQSRSAHVTGAQGKASKPVRRFRTPAAITAAPKPDPAMMREPAVAPKLDEKHSQASSPEHLRKLQRLPKLRAPYAVKTTRPGPA